MPLQRQSDCDSYLPPKPAHLIWYGDALKTPAATKPAPTPPAAKGRLVHS